MKAPRGCIYKREKKRRARYKAFILPDGTVGTRRIPKPVWDRAVVNAKKRGHKNLQGSSKEVSR
jgi:hypothetical protein